MLNESAEWPNITPNIQRHRMALIERRSRANSELEPDSAVNLYQFRVSEKLTNVESTTRNQKKNEKIKQRYRWDDYVNVKSV